MAQKRDYPIEIDIAPAAAQPGPLATPGRIARTVVAAAPAVARGALAPATLLTNPMRTQESRIQMRDGWDRLVGNPVGGKKYAVTPEAKPATARPKAATPKPKATRAQRANEGILGAIESILSQPFSIRQAQAAAGMMPNQVAGPTAKDQATARASAMADLLLKAELDSIASDKTLANDPVAMSLAQDKATEKFLKYQAVIGGAGLGGVLQQDQLFAQGNEEQN